jgi:hypothetical protein
MHGHDGTPGMRKAAMYLVLLAQHGMLLLMTLFCGVG